MYFSTKKTAKLATLQTLGRRSKMIGGFAMSDPKLGRYDIFLGKPKFLTTSVIKKKFYNVKIYSIPLDIDEIDWICRMYFSNDDTIMIYLCPLLKGINWNFYRDFCYFYILWIYKIFVCWRTTYTLWDHVQPAVILEMTTYKLWDLV